MAERILANGAEAAVGFQEKSVKSAGDDGSDRLCRDNGLREKRVEPSR